MNYRRSSKSNFTESYFRQSRATYSSKVLKVLQIPSSMYLILVAPKSSFTLLKMCLMNFCLVFLIFILSSTNTIIGYQHLCEIPKYISYNCFLLERRGFKTIFATSKFVFALLHQYLFFVIIQRLLRLICGNFLLNLIMLTCIFKCEKQ